MKKCRIVIYVVSLATATLLTSEQAWAVSNYDQPLIPESRTKYQDMMRQTQEIQKRTSDLINARNNPVAQTEVAPPPAGFRALDQSSVDDMKAQLGGGRVPLGEPGMAPTGPQQAESLPPKTTWNTNKNFLGAKNTPPPTGTTSYALRSGIGGRTLAGMDSSLGITPDLHKSTRGNQPLVDDYMRSGGLRTASNYQIDYIVPLWAGGTDTADNKQVLDTDSHNCKTAVDNVVRRLLYDKTITLNDAKVLTISAGYLDASGLTLSEDGGLPSSMVANKKLAQWRADKPYVGVFASVVEAMREIGNQHPDTILGKSFLTLHTKAATCNKAL